jgi:hypothetical protein
VYTAGSTGRGRQLFIYSSFTFTNAGATGREGPTLAQLIADPGYQAQYWTQDPRYLNETVQGVQIFTIPLTGIYDFTVAGAQGGGPKTFLGCAGGLGAQITVQAQLTIGDKISIVIGQAGTLHGDFIGSGSASGGGGSYVFLPSGSLLAAAGGGGGANCYNIGGPISGQSASLTINGTAGVLELVCMIKGMNCHNGHLAVLPWGI